VSWLSNRVRNFEDRPGEGRVYSPDQRGLSSLFLPFCSRFDSVSSSLVTIEEGAKGTEVLVKREEKRKWRPGSLLFSLSSIRSRPTRRNYSTDTIFSFVRYRFFLHFNEMQYWSMEVSVIYSANSDELTRSPHNDRELSYMNHYTGEDVRTEDSLEPR
jgi:hypothetical protein